jgi:Putative Ig domain
VTDADERTGSTTYFQKVQLDLLPLKLKKTPVFGNVYTPLSALGGPGPFQYSVFEGALPEGVELVSFKPGETVLDGTPFTAGTYAFTLEAKDESTGYTGARSYKWKVPLSMTPESGEHLPEGAVGHAYVGSFDAVGGSDYSYALIEGQLPEGLHLEQEESVEAIRGTPVKAETQKITVQATDTANGLTAKAKYTIVVAPFAFPRGLDVLEEENLEGDELKGRDEVFLVESREKAGVASGTMSDSDGSTGTWRLEVATGKLVFHWPEHEHSGGLTYEGHCTFEEAEQCTGLGDEFVWKLAAKEPET